MLKNKLKIFENFVDRRTQEHLKDMMLGDFRIFPWYFIKDVTKDTKIDRPAMQHEFVSMESGANSEHLNDILPIVKKIERPKIELLRVNAFLQFPNPSAITYDTPHFDLPKYQDKYTILIYYVIDSDGETVIFDNKNKIIKKIKPKQGTAVMFCGSLLHTAYQPKKQLRSLINFNIDQTVVENIKHATP
jgi:hypothetical protein